MDKAYDAKKIEKRIYEKWEKGNYFAPVKNAKKKPFVVVIPPPNVTGSLHMGHALNNTIQDTLVRWNRMRGIPSEWVPGTDHAGIATQNVVEKKLAKEGKSRFDLGRAKFEREVWKWKDEYEARILGQLKTLGCSCDWSRTRFTMDKGYTKAILRTFQHYYDKGYIYRDHRITNWCPRCHTSLSDLEVEHEEHESYLWYIRYPVSDPNLPEQYIEIATTRPETMLGDTAIAVNPKDNRYKQHIGRKVTIPIANREIPIIADDMVDMEFGTGAVKVTPAHDPNDFEIGKRHNLKKISVIDLDGKMTPKAGKEFTGLDRFEAREELIEILKEGKWLVEAKKYVHNVGHCYRCHSVVEPLLTMQWYVKMDKLKKPAIKVVKEGKVKFHPKKWEKVYLDWMENINDWCISRQIWWGHQIPAWYCECGEIIVSEKWALKDADGKKYNRECPKCKSSKLKRDEDVLDTWFSSALWPFAVFGWPEKTKDLEYFYPTTFLSTARDIIYLWVARMIFSSMEFIGEIPFKDVYIHPTVFNHEGRRMSKSLGTGVDPLELIDKYGTDATRFGLLWQIGQGQDIKFSEDAILNGKRFANKIWNATRFVLMNLEDYKGVSRETIKSDLTKNDKEIIKKLNKLIENTNKNLEKYNFQHTIEDIYDFFWHEFCDKCIEDTKIRIRENDKTKLAAQYTLDTVLKNSLKLLHPIIPFVTEAIWENLNEKEALIVSDWPEKIEF